jgi:lipopolysaccharide/colanic/teichoic acid biosynthesis glycosyltransferase
MLKRAFDIAASGLGLIVLSPLLAIIALAIRLDSAGPVFHRTTRVGKNGKPFRLVKFRSMIAGADQQGSGITAAGDARITRIGAFLRRRKLDELPQLWNVLMGQMSFVGPRPEDPRYVEHYTEEQRQVLAARPGITSPASLVYRHEERILQGNNRPGICTPSNVMAGHFDYRQNVDRNVPMSPEGAFSESLDEFPPPEPGAIGFHERPGDQHD